MRHIDLFTGVGGFAYAAQQIWGGAYKPVVFCELKTSLHEHLRNNFSPDEIVPNILDLKGSDYGKIDLLTGGFPCQPFSSAGHRKGEADDRYLWPEMFRVIRESRPTWIIGENVAGIASMVSPPDKIRVEGQANLFDSEEQIYSAEQEYVLYKILEDIESIGYSVQAFAIPACAIGAPHNRNRVWIIANSNSVRWTEETELEKRIDIQAHRDTASHGQHVFPNAARVGYSELWGVDQSAFCASDYGIPKGMEILEDYGNAIVPQVAMELFSAIKSVDEIIEQGIL